MHSFPHGRLDNHSAIPVLVTWGRSRPLTLLERAIPAAFGQRPNTRGVRLSRRPVRPHGEIITAHNTGSIDTQ